MRFVGKTTGTVAATLLGLGLAPTAFSATVKQVSVKKGYVIIELDDGETIAKESEVCFFGDDGAKVGCGKMTKIKDKKALVKVESKKDIKAIKADMAAKASEAKAGDAKTGDDAAAATAAAGDDDADKKVDDKKTDEKKDADDSDDGSKKSKKRKKKKKKKKGDDDASDDSASDYKGKKQPFRVFVMYGAALATPTVYNKIGYAAPAATPASTLWAPDTAVKSSLLGFNLQLGIPLGSFSLNPGVRYRKFTPAIVDADYNPDHENPYVTTNQSATALGLWFDLQYFSMPIGKSMNLNLTAGLDFDQSTVTLSASKSDDTGVVPAGPIGSATDKILALSLRVGASLDVMIAKPVGLTFGLQAMKPLTQLSHSYAGNIAAGEDQGVPNPASDLDSALGHKLNSFAVEIDIGTVLSF